MAGLFIHRNKNASVGKYKSHFHVEYEIYYLKSGEVNYTIEDKLYRLTPGSIALIPKSVIHNTSYPGAKSERLLVNFDDSFIGDNVLLSAFDSRVVLLSGEGQATFEKIFARLEREYQQHDRYYRLLCKGYITELLALILRSSDVGEVTQSLAGYADTMQKAISYVNEHYNEKLPLDFIAQNFSLSKSFFSRTFKDVTGFGFSEYVTLVRLKNAERLLSETELPVTEIAFRCGFNDSSYFTSVFRRILGVSPLKYRKNNKGSNQTK